MSKENFYDNTDEVTPSVPETDPEDLMETAKLREKIRIVQLVLDKGNTKLAQEILQS